MSDNNLEPCPYKSLPEYAFWRRSIASRSIQDVDPIVSTKFKIEKNDKIATAGSCFAQHIARFLSQSGYNYLVTEQGHPILNPEIAKKYNYGTFSARYGNLYTTRQLLQTLQRAYGEFEPVESSWEDNGRFFDPFRPQIQPNGFSSAAELVADREGHYAAIRKMVEGLDVFVFTLGLTEAWQSKEDGAMFPVCPGCGPGEHDSSKHEFVNFGVEEVYADLQASIELILSKNIDARFLLTVSPVPLIATYEKQHVLASTTYSKSVLRVAAEMAKNASPVVDYFPSYEIMTGNFSKGVYYEDNLRDIREEGVRHAMGCFFRHYLDVEITIPKVDEQPATALAAKSAPQIQTRNERLGVVVCDEEILDQ